MFSCATYHLTCESSSLVVAHLTIRKKKTNCLFSVPQSLIIASMALPPKYPLFGDDVVVRCLLQVAEIESLPSIHSPRLHHSYLSYCYFLRLPVPVRKRTMMKRQRNCRSSPPFAVLVLVQRCSVVLAWLRLPFGFFDSLASRSAWFVFCAGRRLKMSDHFCYASMLTAILVLHQF